MYSKFAWSNLVWYISHAKKMSIIISTDIITCTSMFIVLMSCRLICFGTYFIVTYVAVVVGCLMHIHVCYSYRLQITYYVIICSYMYSKQETALWLLCIVLYVASWLCIHKT